MTIQVTPESVLQFWFEECTPQQHFQKNPEFDASIDARFGDAITAALEGELDEWAETQAGALALVLLLDQFTRNVYRGTPRAFAGDPKALSICALCIEKGYLQHPDPAWRQFMLSPMMHSEDIRVQRASIRLYEEHTDSRVVEYAIRHQDIIAQFGRFPHRNEILGRPSSEEEEAFLKEPGSSF
jgi:uncharacterized protein (DUF924 family)